PRGSKRRAGKSPVRQEPWSARAVEAAALKFGHAVADDGVYEDNPGSMSDSRELVIHPTPAVVGTPGVAPVRSGGSVATPGKAIPERGAEGAAASTGGDLRAAYAQLVVNPDTHDVVI